MSAWPAWSPAESDYLEQLAGDVPFPELLRRMRDRGECEGWPVRTVAAIRKRMYVMGLECRARHGTWTTTGGAAELLGVPIDRVSKWLENRSTARILQPKRISQFHYVTRAGWRRLAQQRPELFGGISSDRLHALLEDRELAERVAAEHPLRRDDYRIRCLETGQVWASRSAAARELHVSIAAIALAMREGRAVTVLGMTFEALRKSAA